MRKFKFGKLVRDKIVQGIKEAGNKPVYRKLDESEFLIELKKKLFEETKELVGTASKDEHLKEIADVEEIVDYLLNVLGISREELRAAQKRKNEKAGSFKKRFFIDHVEAEDDSEWIEYYLKSPDKYPEIK